MDVMMAAGEEMSQLVGEQDHQQREGKGQAARERQGVTIDQGESANEFVEGDGLVVGVGDRELGAGYEAGAEREEKESARENKRLDGRVRRDRTIVGLSDGSGAPIDGAWWNGGDAIWERVGHEVWASRKATTNKYSITSCFVQKHGSRAFDQVPMLGDRS